MGSLSINKWWVDRKGYPYIWVESPGLWMQFYPVTKVQYEEYLLEQGKGNQDYEPLLALNPRVSLRKVTNENYERVFISGVLIEEAKAFSTWLESNRMDIPDVEDWQKSYRWASRQPSIDLPECSDQWNANAQSLWKMLKNLLKPETLAQQMLLEKGLLEWARGYVFGRPIYSGLGKPRGEFARYLRRPDAEPVSPINPTNRSNLKDFGFRLVRKK